MLAHSRCLFNWAERWLKMIEDDDLLFKEVNNIRKIKVRPDLIWFEHGWSWFFRVFLACICGAVPWAALDRPLFTSHVWSHRSVRCMSSKQLWCQVLLSLWQLSDLSPSLRLWEVASLFESSLYSLTVTVRLRLFYPNSKRLQLLLASEKRWSHKFYIFI